MRGPSVSITVVGGYLGAGKTTLLNHLLRESHGEPLGVVVNDFGAINIDAELVVGVDGELVQLSNGCICCSMRDDLVEAIRRLQDVPNPPRRVIVEASGVSDPRSIARTIEQGPSRDWATMDAIIVVVDAEQHLSLSRRERIVAGGQIAAADILVLNKIDHVEPADLEALQTKLRRQSRSGRVLCCSYGKVAPALVLGVEMFDGDALADVPPMHVHVHSASDRREQEHEHEHRHGHGQEFWTWSFVSSRPLSARRLKRAINTLPVSVVRAKGTVSLGGHPDNRAVLHVVGRRAELSLDDPWGESAPSTSIVLIGMGDPMDDGELRARFEACEVEPGEGGAANAVMRWVRRMLPAS